MSSSMGKKSLAFYQLQHAGATCKDYEQTRFMPVYLSQIAERTMNNTYGFENELLSKWIVLQNGRDKLASKVSNELANNPGYVGARRDGVDLAWRYEKADIEMGGKGSANWNPQQREEILKNGHVRGAEGHHQKNVAAYPEEQGNPDNIKFYKSRKEHLEDGHHGDFRNESDAPFIEKDDMLIWTNRKRIIKNEMRGLGIAAAIGAGIGFGIGFMASLAETGVSPDSLKYALAEGGKTGAFSGTQSAFGYLIGRTVGKTLSVAIQDVLSNAGVEITKNITKMCNMGAIGVITIAVFSICQFAILLKKGKSLKEASIQVGKQALFSISLLAVSIAAQGIWGGPAGLIVSISSGIIIVSYSVAKTVHQRKLSSDIREYMIDKCKPLLAV